MIKGIWEFIMNYKYIVVPFGVWFGIQLFKLLYDLVVTKKFNFKRILQAGGMPSSHSAVVVALTTMIAKEQRYYITVIWRIFNFFVYCYV